jgi:hypothetical protein
MSKARRDPINVNNTRAFIDAWRAFFHTHSCPDKHVINADEMLLRAKKDLCGAAHLESCFKAGGSEFISSKSVIGSLIPFVSQTGTTWLLVFCLKISAEGHSKDIEVFIPTEERHCQLFNTPHDMLVIGSTSGLMNSHLWEQAVNTLIDIICKTSLTPSQDILLVTDNLGCHRQPAAIKQAMEKGLFQLYFPPNCSHWIQPLDNLLFAGVQMIIRRITEDTFECLLFWQHHKVNLTELIMEATMEAVAQMFTPERIRKAWANVGLLPFDEVKILAHAQLNSGPVELDLTTSDDKPIFQFHWQ